ncbi:MAG: hypothetical protein COV35_05290 [Alphaproteobacteria bacterium CG11_big_fil_rev_8_21_14_0_20_39_49]|nr:MAG: hypothetical protein COV35_05290 [Alphaproteobacteria bacterium CG11_big_fil_rev_8_21_14_0_20_39_49]
MEDDILLRTVVKVLTPFIFMFGLYVQFHGEYSPGGGFQAGVICAAAFISHALINGLGELNRIISEKTALALACMGVLIYGGTGVVAMTKCGNFLDYSVLTEGKCIEQPIKGNNVYDLVEIEGEYQGAKEDYVSGYNNEKCQGVSKSDKAAYDAFESDVVGAEKCVKTKVRIDSAIKGQHLGIIAIEAGVGLTVFSVMMLIFFIFAKRDS